MLTITRLSNSLASFPNPGIVILINAVHVFGWNVMQLHAYILSEEAHGFAVAPPGTIWPSFPSEEEKAVRLLEVCCFQLLAEIEQICLDFTDTDHIMMLSTEAK